MSLGETKRGGMDKGNEAWTGRGACTQNNQLPPPSVYYCEVVTYPSVLFEKMGHTIPVIYQY